MLILGNDGAGSKPRKQNKLKTEKQINAELMARNAENQLRAMEKKTKLTERAAKNRRSKSEAKQPLQVDTQSAEYWQKRRQEKIFFLFLCKFFSQFSKKMCSKIFSVQIFRERIQRLSVCTQIFVLFFGGGGG